MDKQSRVMADRNVVTPNLDSANEAGDMDGDDRYSILLVRDGITIN